ncbi:MAG: protein kinase [Pyrinomonadaceae bacterium]
MIGQAISRYQIVEQIGSGGMGVVYAADDPHLGRRVAIKLLDAPTDESLNRARFQREAQALSSISHPNIATVHDYGETDDGRPFLVLELIEGKTLSELLEAGALDLSQSVEIIIQVAIALTAAHEKGIIHRDIKPSNIMVTGSGAVKVLDFGLAKQVADLSVNDDPAGVRNDQTQTGIVVGTPLYLSPEQAKGLAVDQRSDVFSLGTVLYECLAGRQPFYGLSAIDIGGQIIHVNPPLPSTVNPDVSPELDETTLKALAKDPDLRYQTAAEFAATLTVAKKRLDGGLKPVPRKPGAQKPSNTIQQLFEKTQALRQKRISVGAVALVAVALVAVVVVVQFAWRKAPHKPNAEAAELVERGTALLRNGEIQRASELFQKAIKADTDWYLPHARYAEALVELDDVDQAGREVVVVNQMVPNLSALPRAEELYVQSLAHSITSSDFGKAVDVYREIATLSPKDAKAQVDLGRAYEKNNEIAKAVTAFRQATDLDTSYATAYLRLGLLYMRQREYASAADVFNIAEKLYRDAGNREGLTQVYHKRGLLFRDQAHYDDSLKQLEQSLALARETGNDVQQVYCLLDESSVLVYLGDGTAAEEKALAGKQLAENLNLATLSITGLSTLGRTLSLFGKMDKAEEYIQQAILLANLYRARSREATAQLNLANLRLTQTRPEEALQLSQSALQYFEKAHYYSSVAYALSMIGRAQRQLGQFAQALESFERRRKLVDAAEIPYEIGSAEGDLASVLVEMERFPDALVRYRTTYEFHDRGKSATLMAYARGNQGEILWRLGQYEEALEALAEEDRVAKDPKLTRAEMSEEVARARGELELSRHNWRKAADFVGPILNNPTRQVNELFIRAQMVNGLAQVNLGNVARGIEECRQAVRSAEQRKVFPLIAYAKLSLAEALVSGDMMRDAADLAKETAESLAQLKRDESVWRAWALAAVANENLGNLALALSQRQQSSAALKQLMNSWGNVVFDGYRKRPDIQASINSLGGAFPTASTSE